MAGFSLIPSPTHAPSPRFINSTYSVENVPEFLRETAKTLTPSDPPLSAYVLGAGFYFDENPFGERFTSWVREFVLDDDGFLQKSLPCDLFFLLALKFPRSMDWAKEPPLAAPVDPLKIFMSSGKYLTQKTLDLYHYLMYGPEIGGIGESRFRGYSIIPRTSADPTGRTSLPVGGRDGYWDAPPAFRPIEIVRDPEKKAYFETHPFHLAARINAPELFSLIAWSLHKAPEETGESRGDADDSDDSSDGDTKILIPTRDNYGFKFLWKLTPLHHAILGFADQSLKRLVKFCGPHWLPLKDYWDNTFIYALICLPTPKTPEKEAESLKIWKATQAVLDKYLSNPDEKKAFLESKNERGLTALHQAVHELHQYAVEKFLTLLGMDVSVLDARGNTLLHTLASLPGPDKKKPDDADLLNFLQFIEGYLLKIYPEAERRKAFYRQVNGEGKTALQIAQETGHAVLVRHLMMTPGVDFGQVNLEAMKINYGLEVAAQIGDLRDRLACAETRLIEMGESIHDRLAEAARVAETVETRFLAHEAKLEAMQKEIEELKKANERKDHQIATLCRLLEAQHTQISGLLSMTSAIGSHLEIRGVLPGGVTGQMACLLRESMSSVGSVTQARSSDTPSALPSP
jgi:hypothetical protein